MKLPLTSLAVLGACAALAACTPPVPDTGAADYAQFCASCHGPAGKGDGPAARGLRPPATDLTLLARDNGGSFPRLRVMNRIDGYTMGMSDSSMPQFGQELREGPTVLFDAGDGVPTPTPARLVALTRHLERMQQ
ncbi:c-type cytochrome [Paracoccus sp. SJTW-4]|uniref:c-type cytochrome n=1 Tax=Paracoccus sp. SJTW-4 TaxID=3078428 RepID=UPI0039EA40B2